MIDRKTLTSNFCNSCVNGYLEVAQWLVQEFELTEEDSLCNNNYVFHYCCANGHLEVAQWLVKEFKSIEEDIRSEHNYNNQFNTACENGHLEVAQWLVKEFKLNRDNVGNNIIFDTFNDASKNGYLEVSQWLINIFGIIDKNEEEEEGVIKAFPNISLQSILGSNSFIANNDELKYSIIIETDDHNYFVGKSSTIINRETIFTIQSIEELFSSDIDEEFTEILHEFNILKISNAMLKSFSKNHEEEDEKD